MAKYPIGARLDINTVPAGNTTAEHERNPLSVRSRRPLLMYNSLKPLRSAGVIQACPSSEKFSDSEDLGVPPPTTSAMFPIEVSIQPSGKSLLDRMPSGASIVSFWITASLGRLQY